MPYPTVRLPRPAAWMCVLLTLALAAPAAAQATQKAAPASSPADTSAQRLRPMVITADSARTAGSGNVFQRAWHMNDDRASVLELTRGNRALQRTLRQQAKTIDRLERKLDSLKAVGAAIERETAALDSATVATRVQRWDLEQRLRDAEGRAQRFTPDRH
jgi:hypothetical protein